MGYQLPQTIQGKRRGKSMNRMVQSVDFNHKPSILHPKFQSSQEFGERKPRGRRDPSPIVGVFSPESLPLSDIFVGGGNAYSGEEQALEDIL